VSEPHELPLFPLGTVLLPGGPLALRVFEPRYLDIVSSSSCRSRCLASRRCSKCETRSRASTSWPQYCAPLK
jgi:Lon protease-like protein